MARLAANYPVNWAGTADDSNVVGVSYSKLAQTFTTLSDASYALTQVSIPVVRTSGYSPGWPGTVTVTIHAVSGGYPTGDPLSTGTFNGDLLNAGAPFPTHFDDINVDVAMSAVSLTGSTQYAVVVTPALPALRWYATNTAGYSGGKPCRYVGDAWENDTSVGDFGFRIWAEDGAGALPAKPTTPAPADTATSVLLGLSLLDWAAGAGETFAVYFGLSPATLVLLADGIAATELAVAGGYSYGTTYYWRVDATNEYGTTTGDVWSFTTLVFDPPTPSWSLIAGGSGNGPTDTPPGVEGVDFRWMSTNNMTTVRRLIVAAADRLWYEGT